MEGSGLLAENRSTWLWVIG